MFPNPFSALTSKIFGGMLVLSLITLGPALYFTRAKLADARETIQHLTNWQIEMVDAIRIASDNPDVDSTSAKAQVQAMGHVRIELTNAIDQQNAAIDEMERQSLEAVRVAQEAEKKRRTAVQRAEALQTELRNRAKTPVSVADLEYAVRQTQDELYEAGL